jgi:hypothetical protein
MWEWQYWQSCGGLKMIGEKFQKKITIFVGVGEYVVFD